MTGPCANIKSILIANRGEIACRIIRTARKMGLRTIAVHSDADASAPHVRLADQSIPIGESPAPASYLNIENIIAAARDAGADAIHPGYGFLSENAAFAKACGTAGIIFIGPPASAIEIMGDKAAAKRRMIKAGVPCVPGYQGPDQSDDVLAKAAHEIGFPVMVKAAAGGGGRGMRLVASEGELPTALATARSEAANAFGASDLILERAIIEPRHVEIQILADQHGTVIHLGDRDCSVQRRCQKIIEEAPAPALIEQVRGAMGAAAVRAAKDVDYVGAGTVEFLLDQNNEFYFLEMNTRLQVEHPVTEMVEGVDLVEQQILVADGQTLAMAQTDVVATGHAIEARLYAEDVANDFLPASGRIDYWCEPSGDGVRVDAGIETGSAVSPFYDPMLAKIIAWGQTREEARAKLVSALADTALFGVSNNKSFLMTALGKSSFADGGVSTAFIDQSFAPEEFAPATPSEQDAAIAAALFYILDHNRALTAALQVPNILFGWSSAMTLATPYRIASGESTWDASVQASSQYNVRVGVGENDYTFCVSSKRDHSVEFTVDGDPITVQFYRSDFEPTRLRCAVNGRDFDLINLNGVATSANESAASGGVTAPMYGVLVDLFVKPGDTVTKGDRLAVLEAMKMQHELIAGTDGVVAAAHFKTGDQIAAGSVLVEIEPQA